MTTLEPGYDTRSRILDAARQLFAERGYAATSLADIASAVGLTKTAVAYHFHPKDRLAAELLAPAAQDIVALIESEFDDEHAFLEALVTFVVRHRTIIRLIMEDIGGADSAPPGSPGEVIRAFRDCIYARLAGPDPGPAGRVRAWAVVGSLQYAVVKTSDLPEEVVREALLTAASAAYGSSA
ncbi:TetR/AcrR family transcriptional regulator [Planobispora siamensis]|uniref:TetR family transcriptional regulator n=1 Tax=Planobispora siamensis TaxID=936338 RepID=A0A8J3SPR4_9ACTN|nr:TetR/AcrR family transcriptional regulator [Planobispora siamensis]GIH96672.1 TetR family transcriptional regulator [Planobispora siamensis]